MSLPPSPPVPWFGGLIAPPLPSPSSRIGGCPSARSPLGMGVRTCFACVRDSGEHESAETGTAGFAAPLLASTHRDTLGETVCFAFCLFPLASSRYSFTERRAARSRLSGSPGPVSLPEKRFNPYSRLLFPFPLQPASEFQKCRVHVSSWLSTVPFSPPAMGKHHSARQGCVVVVQCPTSTWGN